jgi:hypothetical protein
MLNEAIEAGKLLKKDNENDKKKKKEENQVGGEGMEDDIIKHYDPPRKITPYEFKAILTWENDNS